MAHARRRRHQLPRLDDGVLRDPDRLSTTVAAILELDPGDATPPAADHPPPDAPPSLVGERAWQAYLRVEEASVARFGDALDQVVRWAYRQGRRGRCSG